MAITNNTNQQINLELSIQISLSGLSFCILHRDTHSISSLKEFHFKKQLNPIALLEQVKQCFETEAELQNKFEALNVIHDNELSTLVPKSIFNESIIADYLKFNTKILKSDFVTFDTITQNQSVNVYIPYVNVNNYIFDLYGDFTFKHASTVLIETILASETAAEAPNFYVNVNKNRFEIVITKEGQLQFYNSFEYLTKEDFIYYILFTAEQLNLDPERLNLILMGTVNKDDALYNITYKYIRHVSFVSPKNNYTISDNSKPKHSNFTLINSF